MIYEGKLNGSGLKIGIVAARIKVSVRGRRLFIPS